MSETREVWRRQNDKPAALTVAGIGGRPLGGDDYELEENLAGVEKCERKVGAHVSRCLKSRAKEGVRQQSGENVRSQVQCAPRVEQKDRETWSLDVWPGSPRLCALIKFVKELHERLWKRQR